MDTRIKDIALLQVVYIFIVPILLMYFGVIPVSWRMPTLLIVTLAMLGIMIHSKWSREKCGLAKPITWKSFLLYASFVAIGLWGITIFARAFGYVPMHDWQSNVRFLTFFIPLSILQEIAYRVFLMPKLHDIFPDHTTVILVNAGLFSLLHIIYPEQALILPLAFAGGLGFAALYEWYPNAILVSVAHIVLNFFAVLYGFFSIAS